MDLRDQSYRSYRYLRLCIAAASFLLPVLLVGIGAATHVGYQPTLSNFYYSESPPGLLRTVFVGLLFLFGGTLIAYRGYTRQDNIVHNCAGIAAFCVATFPMECPFRCEDPRHDLCGSGIAGAHYASALILFGLAVVSVYSAGGRDFMKDATSLVPNDVRVFKKYRKAALFAIGLGVVIAFAVLSFSGMASVKHFAWLPEALAFWGFSGYWLALTQLIGKVNSAPRPRLRTDTNTEDIFWP